jgi:hypothetical protein
VGVVRCEGRFAAGDAVEIAGASSAEVAERRRGVEAVHRDRLVLFDEPA